MCRKFLFLLLSLLLLAALFSCKKAGPEDGKVSVSVTIDPLYEFAAAVGGDKVTVHAIVPPGAEAHDFEPKAADLVALGSADVLVMNGLGMDDWAEKAAQSAKNDGLIAVTATDGAELLTRDGKTDMHVWLSLLEAAVMTENIRDALIRADPNNEAYYTANSAAYCDALRGLYDGYAEKLAPLAGTDLVTDHAAFGYLCRDFGLDQVSIRNLYADGEPNARQLKELVDFCRENGVRAIFCESSASPAVAETLAREVSAEVWVLHTMESAQEGKTYLERMEDNLSIIYDGLAG